MRQDDIFTYTVQFAAVAAAGVVQGVINFDGASDFLWMYSAYEADTAAAAQTEATRQHPLADVLIVPSDTSSQFMSAAVPVPSIFGSGANPFVLPAPRLIPSRSVFTFTLTNRDAAGLNLYLQLIGIRKYLRRGDSSSMGRDN